MKYKLGLLAITFVGAFAAEINVGCSNRFIVKTGYSKLNNDNLYKNHMLDNALYQLESEGNIGHINRNFCGHRVFGFGYSYKHYLPKDFFIGFNTGYENSDNKVHSEVKNDQYTTLVDFKLKHSINIMPVVGITIKNFDIYAMMGIEYKQVNYSQRIDIQVDSDEFNDYKVHNWRGMYTWGAGVDMRINEKASLGIEYKKTRIKFSFIEYPNDLRDKTHFKADHHTVSVTFKYKF